MKLKLYIYILFIFSGIQLFSQHKDFSFQHTKSGNFNFNIKDGKYQFRPGGRFTFDAASFGKDKTPLSSGTLIKEARLNTALKVDKMNFFFEIDFAKNKVTLKDITARYNFTDHSFIKVGHFTEPFSANYLTTTEKVAFIGRPSMATAFAPTRSLGISYRYFNRNFWLEAGAFGDDVNQTYQGSDGFAFTGRVVAIPIDIPHSHLHLGLSASYRKARSRGFDEDGSTKYNRKLNYTAGLQTYVNTEKFLTAYIGPSGTDNYGQTDLASLKNGGALSQVQFGFEVLDVYKRFYWQFEYINTTVNRIMNKEKILYLERDGNVFPENWEDISYKYGSMRPLHFNGYYFQMSYLLFGEQFKYSRYSSTLKRLTSKSLQLSARYAYTNLNDIQGEYINGKFYTQKGLNQSIAGGITSAYSFSLNYVFNAHFRIIGEYTYQQIDNYIEDDESINFIQARVQATF